MKRRKFEANLKKLENNPLDLFPTKGDVIRRTFLFSKSTTDIPKKISSESIEESQWLSPSKMDPSFGVSKTSEDSSITKAYRRLASSSIFASSSAKDTPLENLHEPNAHGKNYVLVDESRLQELIKLDSALQRERELLGEQCVTIFRDSQMSARIPIPATRYAIRNVCEQQMTKTHHEILKLQQQWSLYCRQNHYHKPHLFLKDSYLNVAPPSQRALKLRLVREATSTWLLRKDRDTMMYEDDMSFLTGLYYDALQRQRDYERYYIIANRYGAFSESEFLQDDRPGKRYFQKITKGAIKFQLLWERYWAVRRLRRFRAARLIQKIWRGHHVYKNLHPIIRLRLKIGKKTYYMFCFAQWKEYNRFCRWIRESIRYYNSNYVERCFFSWRNWAKETREIRNRRMGKLLTRAKNPVMYRFFRSWKGFRTYILALRRRLKLVFSFPHFYMWVDYTKTAKLLKKLHKHARILQYFVRTFLIRCRFLHKKRAKTFLNLFAYLVLSKRRVRRIRDAYIQRNFDDWLPSELLRRAHRANELEKQRLQKKQAYLQDKERLYVKELVKFLSSTDGVKQLQYLARTTLEETLQTRKKSRLVAHLFGLSTREKHAIYDHYARLLRDECVRVVRVLEAFSYDSRCPPVIRCPHPACAATFTAEEQYHNHYFTSKVHQEEETRVFCVVPGYVPARRVLPTSTATEATSEFVMNYTHFHMMLRHKKGQDIFRNYFLRVYGLSGVINVLDCWLAFQDWKKNPATSEAYYQKAFQIYELYLSPGGTRRVDIMENNTQESDGHSSKEEHKRLMATFERLHRLVTTHAIMHESHLPKRNGKSPTKAKKLDQNNNVGSTPARPFNAIDRDPLTFPGFFRTIDLDFLQNFQDESNHTITNNNNNNKPTITTDNSNSSLPLPPHPAPNASPSPNTDQNPTETSRHPQQEQEKETNETSPADPVDAHEPLPTAMPVTDVPLPVSEESPEATTNHKINHDNNLHTDEITPTQVEEEQQQPQQQQPSDLPPQPFSSSSAPEGTTPIQKKVHDTTSIPVSTTADAAAATAVVATTGITPTTALTHITAAHINSINSNNPLSLLSCFGWGTEGLSLGQVIWTPDMILLPSLFETIEYACFTHLYLAFKREEPIFRSSSAYRDYTQTLQQDAADLATSLRRDYEQYRWSIVRDWARHFKAYDNVIVQRAEQVCDLVLTEMVDRLWQRAAKQEVHRWGQSLRLEEQQTHEETALLRDEALAWTEENILNDLFDFYVRAFLSAMWQVPAHRKGMLQYSGLMKVTMKKRGGAALGLGGGAGSGAGVKIGRTDAGLGKLIAEVNDLPVTQIPAEEFKVWFDAFFSETAKLEKATMPLSKDLAARHLQRRVRGMQGRQRARKEFAKRFKKYYDETSQVPYYCDTVTNETSWTRPRLFVHLYPKAQW